MKMEVLGRRRNARGRKVVEVCLFLRTPAELFSLPILLTHELTLFL